MTASQYQANTTLREHLAYIQWLRNQWDEPSRSDHYLMQIAHLLIQQKGKRVPFHKCKLKFTKDGKSAVSQLPSRKRVPTSEEEKKIDTAQKQHVANVAKTRWIGMLGGAKKIRILKPGDPYPK